MAKRPVCVLNYTHFLLFFAFLPQSVGFKEHLWTSVHTVPFCKMSQNFFVGSNLSQKSEKTAAIAGKLKRRGEKRKYRGRGERNSSIGSWESQATWKVPDRKTWVG